MDKRDDMHGYCHIYDELFTPLRRQPVKFLEIGVEFGLSARMWLEYFPYGRIYGVDIADHGFRDSRFSFNLGDQRDPQFWKSFLLVHGGSFEVIIDDGCHKPVGTITAFEQLWPHINPGGIYICEDLMTSYLGSCREPSWPTAIEYFKGLVDGVNAHTAYRNTDEPRQIGDYCDRKIAWIRFSEELVIIRKKP